MAAHTKPDLEENTISVTLYDENSRVFVDEAKLARKITYRIVPILAFAYLFELLIRGNINNAHDDMCRDLGLSPDDYATGVSAFFAPYMLFQIPANFMIKRLNPARWLAFLMVCFSLAGTMLVFVRGVWSLVLLRGILGLSQAGFYPGFIYYLTTWYPSSERASKIAVISSIASLAGLLGGCMSWGLLQMEGVLGLHGWQWIFLVEGLPVLLLSIVVPFFLPNSPEHTTWLTEDEKRVWKAKLHPQQTQDENSYDADGADIKPAPPSDSAQLLRTFACWKVWAMGLGMFTAMFFSDAVSPFATSIWVSLGLSEGQASLIGAPISIVSLGLGIAYSTLSEWRGRVRHSLFTVIGFILAIGLWILLIFSIASGLHTFQAAAMLACQLAIGIGINPMFAWASTVVQRVPGGGATMTAVGIAMINSLGHLSGVVGPRMVTYAEKHSGSILPALYEMCGLQMVGTLVVVALAIHDRPRPSKADVGEKKPLLSVN